MGLAAEARDARIAEARRVMELSARHGIAFEFTTDGWRMVETVPVLPPLADHDMPDSVQFRTAIIRPIREGTTMPTSARVIREWAIANGYQVGARGRIPAHVTAAYAAQRTPVARAS